MQKETRFSAKVRAALSKIPGVWFVKTQQVAVRGTPDYLICAGGIFVAWELKVGNNKGTPLQTFNLEAIQACGGTARIVTPATLDEALQEVREYAEHYFETIHQVGTVEEN